MLILHLLPDPIQTWQKDLAQILLLTQKVGLEFIDVSLVLMTSSTQCQCVFFLQIQFHFTAIFQKFAFMTMVIKVRYS